MTTKQKTVIAKIVENRGNIGRAMIEAGYSEKTARNPKNLTDSKGYREALNDFGLTEALIVEALVEDIKKKKGKRTQELSLGAEILGMKKMGPIIANQVSIHEKNEIGSIISDDKLQEIADMLNEAQKVRPSAMDTNV